MKTNLHTRFAVDTAKETGGVPVEIAPGVTFTIGRWGNPKHKAAEDALRKPFEDRIAAGLPLSEDESREISTKAMAEGLLLGWDGVVDADTGVAVPYSVEAAAAMLADPEMHDLREVVFQRAIKADAFRKYAEKQIEGN